MVFETPILRRKVSRGRYIQKSTPGPSLRKALALCSRLSIKCPSWDLNQNVISPIPTPCRVKMLLASTPGWQQMHLFAECFHQKPGRPSHLPVKWDSYCLAGVPSSSEHSPHGTQKPWDAPGRRWRPLGLHPVSSQVLDRCPKREHD